MAAPALFAEVSLTSAQRQRKAGFIPRIISQHTARQPPPHNRTGNTALMVDSSPNLGLGTFRLGWCLRVATWVGVETLGATIRTEPLVVAVVRDVRGGVPGPDLHAAHRVGRVGGTAAEPVAVAVAVKPIQIPGNNQEDDVPWKACSPALDSCRTRKPGRSWRPRSGHYAVQIASAFGYRVVGVDVGEDRLELV
jgi:hypothetical protein